MADVVHSLVDGARSPEAGIDLSVLRPEVAAPLAALRSAVDAAIALASFDRRVDGREAAAMAAVIGQAVSRLGVAQAQMVSIIEADGLWSVDGARSMSAWVSRRLNLSVRAATAEVSLSRALRDHLPVTASAAAAGTISVEHAHVLASLAPTTPIRRQVLGDTGHPCNEAYLVAQARVLSVDGFRRVVRRWAAMADPDADDRGYRHACDREFVELSPTTDGYHLAGFLTVDHGQALRTALQAITPVPAAGDERTTSQRRAQAVGDMARMVLDHGLAGTGRAVRPRIGVLVSYETLRDVADRANASPERSQPGPAPELTPHAVQRAPQFDDGSPVPRVLLDRLACDGELNRYIFGPGSEVLDVGRAQRTFTGALRSAIVARDQHCRYPGCHAPPAISECHHVHHWARDYGPTSVANGIMLCWHHHALVHARGIEIHRHADGWVFTDGRGRPITDPPEAVHERGVPRAGNHPDQRTGWESSAEIQDDTGLEPGRDVGHPFGTATPDLGLLTV